MKNKLIKSVNLCCKSEEIIMSVGQKQFHCTVLQNVSSRKQKSHLDKKVIISMSAITTDRRVQNNCFRQRVPVKGGGGDTCGVDTHAG